ncbi:peptide-methionine (S)-S-oxide reductase MsrA [Algihabitans albus]|uniref:peptide-methionine (S)-S-oxide reductase MsrA n=1 Tax=Algihabitans albus TaxID=2164067 RepID=UPI000E5CBE48|nr:peptide-methionine (S)-S-oxide reductase MsrA [Algihabitans albus]
MEKAIFAAGCFWGIEAAFRRLPGVTEAISGYTGGITESPSYEQVCGGQTGHAEAVEVTYDPAKIGYGELVDIFFELHDPTQINRQGPDIGTQYRSGLFPLNDDQAEIARAKKQALIERGRDVATEITPGGPFWPAEDYHQRYFEKRGLAQHG